MNTNKLKAYAPKARLAFMDAVRKRAAVLGIYEDRISEASTQGTDTLIEVVFLHANRANNANNW
ncbi:hypothetical protein [Vibrio parahaemolyticus]|uniref:hypothetical protein n=1 Tax=Vibrio parahaemolyticus TaxID=670 RepID=UPI002AC3438D|nr:hypothetical protein [Vibrio parahaemolyticus]